jgi:CysZ protein
MDGGAGQLGSAVAADASSRQDPMTRGFHAAIQGMKAALGDREVGRAYLRVAAAIFALSVVLDAAAIWAVLEYVVPDPDAGRWMVLLMQIARILAIVVAILIGPLLAVFVVNIAFPMFNQGVFLAGMKAFDPERAAILGARPGMAIPRAAGIATVRLLVFFGLSLCLFFVGLIPVVGTIVATVGEVYLLARTASWELMDPYFDVLDIRYAEQREFVREHRKCLLGFGLPVALLLAIPILGPLGFGLAQAAAGRFVALEIPVDPRERAPAA